MRNEVLICSDYERKGSVYFFDRVSGFWFGHWSSKSRWVHYVKAPMVLQSELRTKAIEQGFDPDMFRKPKTLSDVVKKEKKKKVKGQKKKSSDTFISLF